MVRRAAPLHLRLRRRAWWPEGPATEGAPSNPTGFAPIIREQPAGVIAKAGNTATLRVEAVGPGTLTYQWQLDTGGGFADVVGATSSSYTTADLTTSEDGDVYRVVVTNAFGSTTSSSATLGVLGGIAPTVTDQPDSADIPIGLTQANEATFAVAATGDAPLTYQWQVNDGGGYDDIVGATSDTYVRTGVLLAESGYQFRCVATNGSGNATSDAATLTTHKATPTEIYGAALHTELAPSGIDSSVGDGNAFQTWTAASGANWSQATANSRPLYSATGGFGGGRAVRFAANGGAGVNRWLSGPNLSALTAGEVFCRMKIDDGTPAGSADGIWHMGGSGFNSLYPFSGGSTYESFGSTVRKDAIEASPGAAVEVYHVWNVSSAAGAWSARRNTAAIHSTGTNVVAFPAAPKLGESESLSRQLTGYVDYLVLVNRACTANERTDTLSYLGF